MRHIFNRKSGILAAVLAAAAMAGAYVGMGESRWSVERVRDHLNQGAAVPAIRSAAVRAEFADTVRYLGMGEDEQLKDEAMAVLRKMTDDPDADVRYAALQGYVRVGYRYDGVTTAEKIERMQEMMAAHPDDTALRAWVATWYGSMIEVRPDEAPLIMPLIVAMLGDAEGTVRVSAAGALSHMVREAPATAPAVLDILLPLTKDADPAMRRRTIDSLTFVMHRGDLDVRKSEVLAALLEGSRDTDAAARTQAVLSLGAYTFDTPEQAELIFPALRALIDDPAEDVRVFVPGRLADIGRQHPAAYAEQVMDVIAPMKYDESPRVRFMLINALRDMSGVLPERNISLLREFAVYKHETTENRHEALQGMGMIAHEFPHLARIVEVQLREWVIPTLPRELKESGAYWLEVAQDKAAQAENVKSNPLAPAPAPAP